MTQTDAVRSEKKIQRQIYRAARQALTPRQQEIAAQQLAASFGQHPLFLRSRRIAFYQPRDGEIDPRPLMQRALSRRRECYLPCVAPEIARPRRNRLWFARHRDPSDLVSGRFGIPEPDWRKTGVIDARSLDLVLMPLVAFDASGHRLGMGLGFYDRTFDFLCRPGGWHRPLLVGLAHACQQADRLPVDDWDLPLAAIVTDRGFHACSL